MLSIYVYIFLLYLLAVGDWILIILNLLNAIIQFMENIVYETLSELFHFFLFQ